MFRLNSPGVKRQLQIKPTLRKFLFRLGCSHPGILGRDFSIAFLPVHSPVRLGRFLGFTGRLIIEHAHRAGLRVFLDSIDGAANRHSVECLFKLSFDINDFPAGSPFLRLSDRHMMESPFDDLLLHTQWQRRFSAEFLLNRLVQLLDHEFVNRIRSD